MLHSVVIVSLLVAVGAWLGWWLVRARQRAVRHEAIRRGLESPWVLRG
jgi:hypothetical protein